MDSPQFASLDRTPRSIGDVPTTSYGTITMLQDMNSSVINSQGGFSITLLTCMQGWLCTKELTKAERKVSNDRFPEIVNSYIQRDILKRVRFSPLMRSLVISSRCQTAKDFFKA
jgi:hypothetical protein